MIESGSVGANLAITLYEHYNWDGGRVTWKGPYSGKFAPANWFSSIRIYNKNKIACTYYDYAQ